MQADNPGSIGGSEGEPTNFPRLMLHMVASNPSRDEPSLTADEAIHRNPNLARAVVRASERALSAAPLCARIASFLARLPQFADDGAAASHARQQCL